MSRSERCACLPAVLFLLLPVIAHAAEQPACSADPDAAVARQAEQKLVLLQRLVGDTAPVQRVAESGNEAAQQALAGARSHARQAGDALAAGCSDDAMRLAADGLALASQAFALVKNTGPDEDRLYRLEAERTRSYLQSLESQPDDVRGIGADDIAGIQRQLGRADELAANGELAAARNLLKPVADRLERRLVAIYDTRTVYYEKSFAGPEDEYAYLAEQYLGCQMLFERFAGDRTPPHSAQQSYDELRASAAELALAASGHASTADWQAALEEIQEAVLRCERAMKLVGIGY